ncbi:unnamed protein product, partial [Schistosoma margrebowiei]
TLLNTFSQSRKLPVPDLHNTLDRYLRLIAPVVSKEDFERTKLLVEEFGKSGGEGEELQNLLKQYAKTKINWVLANGYLFSHSFISRQCTITLLFVKQSILDREQLFLITYSLGSTVVNSKSLSCYNRQNISVELTHKISCQLDPTYKKK